MRHRGFLVVMLAIVTVLALATTALADKPDKPGKPTTTTTTAAMPDLWTCRARVDNGATGWEPLGLWTGTAYVSGLPACIDILEEHHGLAEWTVAWTGATRKGTVKGLKLVFEREVHATTYAEAVFTTEAGVWCPVLEPRPTDNLVFVAMPRSGDRWYSFEITVTPGHGEICPG